MNHLASSRGKHKYAKGSAPGPIDDELSVKQTWIRGVWSPPRTAKTPLPPEPSTVVPI